MPEIRWSVQVVASEGLYWMWIPLRAVLATERWEGPVLIMSRLNPRVSV
jgi:hypothetical protein